MTQQNRTFRRKLTLHMFESLYQTVIWALAGHLFVGSVVGLPRVITEMQRVEASGEWSWGAAVWLNWFAPIYATSFVATTGILGLSALRRAFRKPVKASPVYRLTELTRIGRSVAEGLGDVSWGQYCRLCDGDQESGHEVHCEVPLFQTELDMAESLLNSYKTKGRKN